MDNDNTFDDMLDGISTGKAIRFNENERRERIEKENAELESRAKRLDELVVTERFTVEDVVSASYPTSHTPLSEMVMGGRSPSYNTGYTTRVILTVKPENNSVPIRTLNYDGISVVKSGDIISATIPRYEKKAFENLSFGDYERIAYVDREFRPEESAIEIAILSIEGKVLRRDRSVAYDSFSRK